MDISLERKFASCFKNQYQGEKTVDVTGDIVVPDTNDDIRKIILSKAKYNIRSKDTDSGKIIIKGEVEFSALYITDKESELTMLKTTLPFVCEFESNDIVNRSFTIADLKIISADTRILNPRKVAISVQLYVKVNNSCISELSWFQKPDEETSKIFFRQSTDKVDTLTLVTEKTFSIEDDIMINDVNEKTKILFSDFAFITDGAEAVGSKLVVKGHSDIKIVYLNNDKLECINKTVSFSQIFELPEKDITPDFIAYFMPTGDYFEFSEDKLRFEIYAVMQIACINPIEISYISDAYACSKQLIPGYQEYEVNKNRNKLISNESLQLSCAAENGSVIEYSEASIGHINIKDGDISVPVTVNIIYCDMQKNINSCKMSGNIIIQSDAYNGKTIEQINAEVENIKTSLNGSEIFAYITVKLDISVTETETIKMISDVSISDEEKKTSYPSAYLIKSDDLDLWAIAKKYSSSEELIKKLNNIEDDLFFDNSLLLIPRIK